MTVFKKPRHLLPAFALFASAFFLVSAVPRSPAPVVSVAPAAASAAGRVAGFDVVRAEVRLCEASSGRSRDDCLDEIEAKALIQHAEQVAEAEGRGAGRDDELAAAARPSRSRLQ